MMMEHPMPTIQQQEVAGRVQKVCNRAGEINLYPMSRHYMWGVFEGAFKLQKSMEQR